MANIQFMPSREVILFGVVGVVSTIFDFTLYFALLDFDFRVEFAKATGYMLGLVNSYIGNTLFAFQKKTEILRPQTIIRFLIVHGTSLVVNVYVNSFAIGLLGSFSVAPALIASILVTFVGLKFFVYRKPEQ